MDDPRRPSRRQLILPTVDLFHNSEARGLRNADLLAVVNEMAKSSFENQGWAFSSGEVSSHRDEYHGAREIDALFIIAHEASPARHPPEGALDNPAAGQDLKPLLVVGSTDDLDHEVETEALSMSFSRS